MIESREERTQAVILAIEPAPDDADRIRAVFGDSSPVNDLYIADTGDEALEFLRRPNDPENGPRPDLVLLDLEVPGAAGEEILAAIDDDCSLGRIPVIVLSSSSGDERITQAYDLRANAYVEKPVDGDEFFEALRAIEGFWLGAARLPPGDDEDEGRIVG